MMMNLGKFLPNKLYYKMVAHYATHKSKDSKVIIVNEGSSRSSKTWDTFHFIVAYCSNNKNPRDIYILRDTLVNCRDFTLKEFQDCLKTIGIYNPSALVQSPKPVYKLWGHSIKFRGLDEKEGAEGYPSDLLFFNEVLDMNQINVMGLVMRCRKLVIMDFNPRYSLHWVFDLQKREDTVFTKSTYRDNRHLQASVIKEIESYEPTPEHIANGTADLFRWKVYGLGERASREGLVFPKVTWVDSFPTDIEEIGFGMDFGVSHNTALVKVGVKRDTNSLYIEKLFYAPTENSAIIGQMINQLKEKHKIEFIWCDNNQPGWVSDLRNNYGIAALLTKKFPGSRKYWIDTMNRFNIHIVKDIDMRKEQENFCYRVVDGITLSETIDKYDDGLSAAGYATVGNFRFDNV